MKSDDCWDGVEITKEEYVKKYGEEPFDPAKWKNDFKEYKVNLEGAREVDTVFEKLNECKSTVVDELGFFKDESRFKQYKVKLEAARDMGEVFLKVNECKPAAVNELWFFKDV